MFICLLSLAANVIASRIALVTFKRSNSSDTQTHALRSYSSFSLISLYTSLARLVFPIPPIPTHRGDPQPHTQHLWPHHLILLTVLEAELEASEAELLYSCMESLELKSNPNPDEKPPSLNFLASMRTLIINPSTQQPTISSVFETLTRTLQLSNDKLVLHHTLKLLTDLAFHHISLSRQVFDAVHSFAIFPSRSTRLTAESLKVLATISELDATLSSAMEDMDGGFFVSLCFGTSVSVRLWLLDNAGRFCIRPSLLFTMFLGFTKDPYPCVRRASLNELVNLSKKGIFEDSSLVEGCYGRAVQLLRDMEDCVRSAAVRVVVSWGLMLASSLADMKTYWSNEVFAKVCSMARDMSMKVRVEAFDALGKMEIVSEEFLLQSISKRILGLGKQKEFLGQSSCEQFAMLAASVAGALVHGLEDEFFEVRKSACRSLQTLTILSVEFAQEALNLLMDVLNDDSMVVRLEALDTMHHMAISDRLKVQEKHLHMFLGALVDNSSEVRRTARKILKVVKLNDLVLFKSSIDGLLKNLDNYPQDEADVFSAVSHMGRNHEKFVIFIIKKVFQEIEAAFEGKLEFNSARVSAQLILSISAPLSHTNVDRIPPVMFSYAATFLGRISCAFNDVMDRDTLLAYLSEKSRSAGYPTTSIMLEEGEQQSFSLNSDHPYNASNEMIGFVPILSQEKDGESEIQSHIMWQEKVVSSHVQHKLVIYNEVIHLINHFLAEVPDMWPLVQSGCSNQISKILRCWKEELATITFDSLRSGDAVAFTLQYLRIIKLLAEVWQHSLPAKRFCYHGMRELDLKLVKLAKKVKELRSRFIGFSTEEELNVLELILVTHAFRLRKVEICCHILTLRRLTAALSYTESLLKQGSTEPSTFVVELRKLLHESGTSINGASYSPFLFDRCLKFFSPKLFAFRGNIRHLEAKLRIPDIDHEQPLSFVSGLSVAIPCEITLYNISTENKLWLSMSMDGGLTQYAFLDLNLFEGVGDVKNYAFTAPFYRTPKANSFTLRVSIGLECSFDNVSPVLNQAYGGPKHELTFLCQEVVYLSQVNN